MKELYKALLKVQSELKPVKRTISNPFYKSKYADLESIVEAVMPLLSTHGILASQTTRISPNGLAELVTSLIHAETGEKIDSVSPIICKDASDPQKFIAATTYARRSSLATICGLATQDDDGNTAADKPAHASPTNDQLRQQAIEAERRLKANPPGPMAAMAPKETETQPVKPQTPASSVLTAIGMVVDQKPANAGGYVSYAIEGQLREDGKLMWFSTKDPMITESINEARADKREITIQYTPNANPKFASNIVGFVLDTNGDAPKENEAVPF